MIDSKIVQLQNNMDWKSVQSALKERLSRCSDSNRVDQFVKCLNESETGHHLGACILIDLHLKLVSCELFGKILAECNMNAASIVSEFGTAVDRIERQNSDIWAKRLREDDDHTPRSYARVMEIGTFIRYCLTPSKYTDLGTASVKRVRLTYFSGPEGRPLGRVTRTYVGARGRVWIVPQEDLNEIRMQHGGKSGTVIRDALGLPITSGIGPDGAPEFVAVVYPKGARIPSAQPSTLDATWTSIPCYFLPSKGASGWGKTYNCAGNGPTCRERVHGALEGLSNAYSGIYIGVGSGLDHSKWRLILAEAGRRLEAIGGST